MIPKEIIKPLDEIKTPSNRILITCLILAIIAMASVIAYQAQGNDKHLKHENDRLREEITVKGLEIKRLNQYIIEKQNDDNMFLKRREAYLDSINNITKYLKIKLK